MKKFLCVTVLFALVLVSTLASELYYPIPIQQYVSGDQYYSAYQNERDNEISTSDESEAVAVASDSAEVENQAGSLSEFGQEQDSEDGLESAETTNYYRPYIRYRQISRRRTRVPISRRYDSNPSYSLSGYASSRDRFPTVA